MPRVGDRPVLAQVAGQQGQPLASRWRAWQNGETAVAAACANLNDSMTDTPTLPSHVRDSLARLAESSDRASPTVFAGREDEFDLLNAAVRGAQRGEPGHTVVIHGVPGAGKTALLNEYAARLLAVDGGKERPTIAVPLRPGDLDASPVAILQEIDRQFREFEASDVWQERLNRVVDGASLLGHALFAASTKRDFNDFRPSARAPDSLPVALDDYFAFRFDRRDSTVVLLVDEAQNLDDTAQVRRHLDALHGGVRARTTVLLACFGLTNTTDRLRELGLSRLATGHVRSIGALSDEDAQRTVTGTLDAAFADFAFRDDARREQWTGAVVTTILADSANFPHHLANGCRALAEIVLDEGIGETPPVESLRDRCEDYRREYYDARLRPWAHHITALAQAFSNERDGWTPVADVKRTLMAADDFGDPVNVEMATAILKELCSHGYVEQYAGACRPVLPSLLAHFAAIRHQLPLKEDATRVQRSTLN